MCILLSQALSQRPKQDLGSLGTACQGMLEVSVSCAGTALLWIPHVHPN